MQKIGVLMWKYLFAVQCGTMQIFKRPKKATYILRTAGLRNLDLEPPPPPPPIRLKAEKLDRDILFKTL